MYRKEFDELVEKYNLNLKNTIDNYESFKIEIEGCDMNRCTIEIDRKAKNSKQNFDKLNLEYYQLVKIFSNHGWKSYKIYPNQPPQYDFSYEKKVNSAEVNELSAEIMQFNALGRKMLISYSIVETTVELEQFNIRLAKYNKLYKVLNNKIQLQNTKNVMYNYQNTLPKCQLFTPDPAITKNIMMDKTEEPNLEDSYSRLKIKYLYQKQKSKFLELFTINKNK